VNCFALGASGDGNNLRMRSSDWNERPGNGVCRRPPHHFVCGDQWCWWRIRTRRSKGEWIPAQAAVGKSEAEGNKRQLRLVGQILRSHPRNATPSPYSTRTRTFPRNTLPHITHSLGTISQNMFKCNEPAVPSGKPTPFFLFTPPPPDDWPLYHCNLSWIDWIMTFPCSLLCNLNLWSGPGVLWKPCD